MEWEKILEQAGNKSNMWDKLIKIEHTAGNTNNPEFYKIEKFSVGVY